MPGSSAPTHSEPAVQVAWPSPALARMGAQEPLLEALLNRRERSVLTSGDRRQLAGQRILVTGAGGWVGAELSRQVAACDPAAIVLVDQSEALLYRIERELRERWPAIEVAAMLCDITRERDAYRAIASAMPDVVYHTAAYKHLLMAERSVLPAIRTNVFGTWHTARAAAAVGARFVLASTDKAASPTTVLGATKRFAEMVTLLAEAPLARSVVVRFGHVLGSSGGLLELLLDQLRRGTPLTLTDPGASRYVMTPVEAASLVIKADLFGTTGSVYWLDMGEPVRIVDLAERLLVWGESIGYPRVPIRFVGLRPGEKLTDTLHTKAMALAPTPHGRIWMARQPEPDYAVLRRVMRAMAADVRRGDPLTALADLRAAVPEYEPSSYARACAMGEALAHVPTQGPALVRASRV